MATADEKHSELVVEIWKTTVDVQKHFNEIEMRIRGLFITLLLALFASIGFLIDKKWKLDVWNMSVEFSVILPLFGVVGANLFYFIDRYWYHRLLVGAVKHARGIEEKYKDTIPELGLTTRIGAESPYVPGRLAGIIACLVVTHGEYRTKGQLHSDGKIEFFYKSVMLVLLSTTVVLAIFGGVSFHEPKQLSETPSIGAEPPGAKTAPQTATPPKSAPLPEKTK